MLRRMLALGVGRIEVVCAVGWSPHQGERSRPGHTSRQDAFRSLTVQAVNCWLAPSDCFTILERRSGPPHGVQDDGELAGQGDFGFAGACFLFDGACPFTQAVATDLACH